jgi:effector-binding domain-containing protein
MTVDEIVEVHAGPQSTAVIRATLTVPEIGPWFGSTVGRLAGRLIAREVPIVGPPFARYHVVDEGAGRFEVEAGFPVAAPIDGDGEVVASSLPEGSLATTLHVGPYEDLPAAYDAVASWIAARGGEPAGDMWEVYESDPEAQPDPATWRTRVYWPYRAAGRPAGDGRSER